jgi:HD-GYP domain-containing protein (c-di-GMP phosphodiesterase class II)
MRSETTRCFLHAMKTPLPIPLLELAIAKLNEGAPEHGLVFALRAVNRAAIVRDEPTRRRALNIASHCCLMNGDYADAIDYGLQAAAAARTLDRAELMVNALLNVTCALTHIGRTEETIEIANRVVDRFASRAECVEDVRQLLTNAANAHLSTHDFVEAIRFSERAIALFGEVNDEPSARARLVDEFNWMKAAIALDQPGAVDARFTLIEGIATSYPSLEHQLNLRFAKALYAHYTEHAIAFAFTELEALVTATEGFSTIQLDVLHALVRLSKQGDDVRRFTQYRRQLNAHGQQQRAMRLQRALAVASSSALSIEAVSPDIDVTATKRWIAALIDEPVANPHHPERTEARLNREQQGALERIAVSMRVSEDLTGVSIYRIGKLTALLSEAIGYSALEARALEWAARLYPMGANALRSVDGHHPTLEFAATLAQNLGEQWDGHGDPRQLSGREIPEAARIAAIAVAYDELTHQGTLPHADAVQRIKAHVGQRFDPALVARFLPMIERLHQQHGSELDRYLAAGAPPRDEARQAHAQLRDLVPGLTLFEAA